MSKTKFLLCVLFLLPIAGCASAPAEMARVRGVVKYADGSPIAGSYAVIRFDPAPESQAEFRKMAQAEIASDGTFDLSTVHPRDGAFLGDYRVTVEIKNDSRDTHSLVAPQFSNPESTPLKASVNGSGEDFEFVVSRK
jgi:hypothetical protein